MLFLAISYTHITNTPFSLKITHKTLSHDITVSWWTSSNISNSSISTITSQFLLIRCVSTMKLFFNLELYCWWNMLVSNIELYMWPMIIPLMIFLWQMIWCFFLGGSFIVLALPMFDERKSWIFSLYHYFLPLCNVTWYWIIAIQWINSVQTRTLNPITLLWMMQVLILLLEK